MSSLTIRIEDDLKQKAFYQAQRMGISITLVVKNALKNFVKNPTITIGEPEDVEVTASLQAKMDKVADILS
ncbi:MAG: hypothetical protein Q8P95_01360 [bacterium]|nr:hypothetical protein [bacterium]